MNGFSNRQIIGGLVTMLIMSYAAFFVRIVASLRELHSRIDRLDEKFSSKIESLTIAVSRLEGAFYHTPPERRVAGGGVA
jgi:hypothetical protein